jgi:hypothetical protein
METASWRDRARAPQRRIARFFAAAVWPLLAATLVLGVLRVRGDRDMGVLLTLSVSLTLVALLSIVSERNRDGGAESPGWRRTSTVALGSLCIAWALVHEPLGWLVFLDVPVAVRSSYWLVGMGGVWLVKGALWPPHRGPKGRGPTGL